MNRLNPNSIESVVSNIIASMSLFGAIIGSISGVIFSFMLPIQNFLLIIACLIIADLITGIIAARYRKEKVQSKAVARTIHKFIVYFIAILVARGMTHTFTPEAAVNGTYFTWIISGTIALREITSVFENVEEITGTPLTLKLKAFKDIFNYKNKKENDEV